MVLSFSSHHEGKGHFYIPSEVPNRANIAALKNLGVKVILAFSAVGSLRQDIAPCDFVLPSQLIDLTRQRPSSFFKSGYVAHFSMADPFCHLLQRTIAQYSPIPIHCDKTLVCIEGPHFSTRAESHMYRQWGCDVINMSACPEARLAREAEIPYQMICMSTDYDCWKTDGEAVTVEAVMKNLARNSSNALQLLMTILPHISSAIDQGELSYLRGSFVAACISHPDVQCPTLKAQMAYLYPEKLENVY
jgi:5'-methylthioadenosine phosphorylase